MVLMNSISTKNYKQFNMGHGQESENPHKGTPLDFTKKHPVFDIQIEKKGPQFSQIDEKRLDFIRKFAGKVQVPQPYVPTNIPGLVPRNGPLPITRNLWKRPSGSFERNGWFNIHTQNLNTRILYPLFFGFLLYGWWGHATLGMYNLRYNDNGELPGTIYDKLNPRVPPVSKIWLRPG